MFRKKPAGGTRPPDFPKEFRAGHDTDGRIHRPSRSPDAISLLADTAADGRKGESERCDALLALSESVCALEADITAVAPRLISLLESAPDGVARAASAALAAHFLEKEDFQQLQELSSHARFPVRAGAVLECEAFVIARGYDSRMGPVFAAGLLEEDGDLRRAARVAFAEGAGAGDEWAAKFLAAALDMGRKGKQNS